jgi:nitronate monooxygenase
MKTVLCDKLGISIPIVLAPMGGAVGPDLTAAVCNAGGLGTIALWRADDATLRGQIAAIRARTDRSFAVNLNLEFPQEQRLEVCIEESVPIISLFWGSAPDLVARAKAGGATVIQTVSSAEEARAAVDSGVDVVVAQGWEAGGHVRGSVATMALVPAVVDAVGTTPVVAAGGIADGRGLAAALALGASGVWIGTRFLASSEATIHPHYRERLFGACETDTVHLEDLFNLGWPDAPHRVLRNETVIAWEQAGRPRTGDRPGEGEVLAASAIAGAIERYRSFTPGDDVEGNIEALSLWAGQGVGLVKKIQPAGDIVREIEAEASATLRAFAAISDQG